jgi:hypothetical protein
MAANGSMPKNALWLTLCGCTIQLTRNSSAVAAMIVADAGLRRR